MVAARRAVRVEIPRFGRETSEPALRSPGQVARLRTLVRSALDRSTSPPEGGLRPRSRCHRRAREEAPWRSPPPGRTTSMRLSQRSRSKSVRLPMRRPWSNRSCPTNAAWRRCGRVWRPGRPSRSPTSAAATPTRCSGWLAPRACPRRRPGNSSTRPSGSTSCRRCAMRSSGAYCRSLRPTSWPGRPRPIPRSSNVWWARRSERTSRDSRPSATASSPAPTTTRRPPTPECTRPARPASGPTPTAGTLRVPRSFGYAETSPLVGWRSRVTPQGSTRPHLPRRQSQGSPRVKRGLRLRRPHAARRPRH